MAWKVAIWGLVLGFLGSLAQAQDLPKARTAFKTYGVESGMDNLAVWSIIQDHQGFIWMATEGGVSRYDGHRFQNFGMDQGLPSGEAFVLHQDPAGNLWAGTYQGLGRWSEGRFVCPDFPRVPVESLATGPEGRIWVSTPQGPYQQEANGGFQKVPGWPGGEATALWAASGTPKVWVASSRSVGGKSETEVFEFEAGQWRSIPCVPGFQSIRLDALAGDINGRLWARSATQLWLLKPSETAFRLAETPPMVAGSRGYLSIDRKGQLWVSTNSSLLTMVGDTWQVMGKEQGFPADFARSISEDREGNLWVAGVGAYRRLGRGVLTTYGTSEGLPSNIIRTIFRDRAHQLWIGTDRGACRAKGGVWEIIPGTANLVARCLVEDSKGRLYMAGNTQEILRYDPKTRSLTRFPVDIGRPTKRIFKLLIDSTDCLWAATEAAGLLSSTCTGSRLDFKPVPLPGGNVSERVSDLFQEPGGRIWACGADGLALLEQGKWQRFGTKEGLREKHVSYVRLTPSGELLVSYFNPLGLTRTCYRDGVLNVIEHLDEKNGLAASKVYLMGEDLQHRLWVGTGRGVDMISHNTVEHFGATDGLPSDDCNGAAFLAEPNGDVWIGTSGGLARFQMKHYAGIPAPPTAVVVNVLAGKRALTVVPSAESIDISYRDNTLEFRFAGLSFLSEGQLEHQTRLVGLETEWYTTTAREARYPGLAQGSYQFEMRARIGRGPWSAPATYGFRILAPWWQRWWFYGSLIAVLLGIIYLYILRLRRQRSHLEQLVAKRTEQLRDATLTDPLTGLRNRRFITEILQNDVSAFVGFKKHLIQFKNQRGSITGKEVFGLFLLDMDHFKHVNDAYGHDAGDQVLRQFADILKTSVRQDDVVVRLGGEEFLVVLKKSVPEYLHAFATKLLKKVAAMPFDLGDGIILHKTCSIGYTSFPIYMENPDLLTLDQSIMVADLAMYYAKEHGRNRAVFLEEGPQKPTEKEALHKIASSLDFALLQGHLKIGSTEDTNHSPEQ